MNINSLPDALVDQFMSLLQSKDTENGRESLENYQIEGWGSINVTMQRIFDLALQKEFKEFAQNRPSTCSGKMYVNKVIVEAPENVEMLSFIKEHFNPKQNMIFGAPRRQFDEVTINGIEI